MVLSDQCHQETENFFLWATLQPSLKDPAAESLEFVQWRRADPTGFSWIPRHHRWRKNKQREKNETIWQLDVVHNRFILNKKKFCSKPLQSGFPWHFCYPSFVSQRHAVLPYILQSWSNQTRVVMEQRPLSAQEKTLAKATKGNQPLESVYENATKPGLPPERDVVETI